MSGSSDPSTTIKNYRVIVADDDGHHSRRLADFLKEKNFDVRVAGSGKELKELLRDHTWVPHFIVVDLMLGDGNVIDICKSMKAHPLPNYAAIKTLIYSSHNSLQNVQQCLKAGASDYVIKPFKFEDMLARLIFQIQNKRQVAEPEAVEKTTSHDGGFYLHLVGLILKEAAQFKKLDETLFNLTKMLAITLKAVRCNIVECGEDRQTGYVKASSDDRAAKGIELDLNRYPEIIHVMNTESVVVIENLDYDPTLAEIKKLFKNISFNSIMVCPLKKRGRFYGVISVRMDKSHGGFKDDDIRFAQLLAHVVSLTISSDLPLPIELQTPA